MEGDRGEVLKGGISGIGKMGVLQVNAFHILLYWRDTIGNRKSGRRK